MSRVLSFGSISHHAGILHLQIEARLTAGVMKASKQPAEQASAEGRGLHDSLADPAISKHVGITTKLAELLGVANADQVGVFTFFHFLQGIYCLLKA